MPNCSIQLKFAASYEIHYPQQSRQLVILLHGYRGDGDDMMQAFAESLPTDAVILAPNAPFPLIKEQERGHSIGYTWYFYDSQQNTYFIEMDVAVDYVSKLVTALELSLLPARIIGFSQGGYLAPFAAQSLATTYQVIAVHSRYRSEMLPGQLNFRVDAIHGALDPWVDPQRSQSCHRHLLANGNQGCFRLLPKIGHVVDAEVLRHLKELLTIGDSTPLE